MTDQETNLRDQTTTPERTSPGIAEIYSFVVWMYSYHCLGQLAVLRHTAAARRGSGAVFSTT